MTTTLTLPIESADKESYRNLNLQVLLLTISKSHTKPLQLMLIMLTDRERISTTLITITNQRNKRIQYKIRVLKRAAIS